MRAFIAIELSEEIRSLLAQIQSRLKYSGADVKWVEEKNIHLTLKFLGEINEEKRAAIESILDDIGKSVEPFEISIKDIGAFPDIDHPRVIWVGLDKGAAESKELARKIDEALSKIGFEKEIRPFAAHLTVGRVRSPKNKEALKQKIVSQQQQVQDASRTCCKIGSIILFQSILSPNGPAYTNIHEVKLS